MLQTSLILIVALFLSSSFSIQLRQSSFANNSCSIKHATSNVHLGVYWINLEKSVERRHLMNLQMKGFGLTNNHRVKGFTPDHLIFPNEKSWKPADCSYRRLEKNESITNSMKLSNHDPSSNKTVHFSGLCGRPKNTAKELAVTVSHLHAIYRAIHNHGSRDEEYALILEDDLVFAAEIDFKRLISDAPKDFLILQLVTSNSYVVDHLFKFYKKSGVSFVKRKENDDFWCAGAYIIHKRRFSKIFHSQIFSRISDKSFLASVTAGYARPSCVPARCCARNASSVEFIHNQISQTDCVKAPRGYQADHFLFAMAVGFTYILTVPLLLNSRLGNISTLHQEHVSLHQLSFDKTKVIIQDMLLRSRYPVPNYVNAACTVNFTSPLFM
jgi:GR25 family glycosyltransferase involved in LPS biosynthesis